MEPIQYICINTGDEWQRLLVVADNVEVSGKGLTIPGTWSYRYMGPLNDDLFLEIVDIKVDENGLLYMINGKTGDILIFDKDRSSGHLLGCRPGVLGLLPVSPSALAIDRANIYIADAGERETGQRVRIMAYSRINLQVRWLVDSYPGGKWLNPILDLKIAPGGQLVVLDAAARVMVIDREGNICQYIHGLPLQQPTDIALDAAGDLYILDSGSVFRYHDWQYIERMSVPYDETGKQLKGLYISPAGQLYIVVESKGEVPGPVDLEVPRYLLDDSDDRLRLFSTIEHEMPGDREVKYGGGDSPAAASHTRVVAGPGNDLFIVGKNGSWITHLEYLNVTRKNRSGDFTGLSIIGPMDSRDRQTHWHRLLFHGEFRKGNRVQCLVHVTDRSMSRENAELLLRSEWEPVFNLGIATPESRVIDALLPEETQGRYLWIKLWLYGDEGSSPCISDLAVFFPRSTYLEYFPAIYKEDQSSQYFLERYLSLFQSLFSRVDLTIRDLDGYFDPWGVPAIFLSWLGSWMALPIESGWPEEKQREFISLAPAFYKYRGTPDLLCRFLQFFTETPVYVVERYRLEHILEDARLDQDCFGVLADGLPGDEEVPGPLYFLPASSLVDPDIVEVLYNDVQNRPDVYFLIGETPGREFPYDLVRRVIAQVKPAHISYQVLILRSYLLLGHHTYLGVNSRLIDSEFRLGRTVLVGRDTHLHDDIHVDRLGENPLVNLNIILK